MSKIRGRFQKDADKLVQRYIASIPFDQRLYHHDIAGSMAHAKMLA
jgi:argininosuccinate lyase